MTDDVVARSVSEHYGRSGIVGDLLAAFAAAGIAASDVDVDALAGADEFHLGGRAATAATVEDLELGSRSHVLDVGCGIGGAARLMAHTTGCRVTGVDLTSDFVDAAGELSVLVGLDSRTSFEVASALDLPFGPGSFDAATMFHVGMNIEDKHQLMAELARVVCSGGAIGVYDIMGAGVAPLRYPMPWATDASTSFVASADEYRAAMRAAGLVPGEPVNRLELVRAAIAATQAHPPPVNLGHLMGTGWPEMFANLRDALQAGAVAPTQIIGAVP